MYPPDDVDAQLYHIQQGNRLGASSLARQLNNMLPMDTLDQIFRLAAIDMDDNITIDLPPTKEQLERELPWVLGRVCSLWRRVSRSIPSLWKISISFPKVEPKTPAPSIVLLNQLRDFQDLRDYGRVRRKIKGITVEQALNAGRYAEEVLPQVTNITLSGGAPRDENDPLSLVDFSPFLRRITKLRWYVTSNPERNILLDTLPPGAFSLLRDLEITVFENPLTKINLSPILVATAPRLERLCFESQTPLFKFTGPPWRSLRSLEIRIKGNDHNIIPIWRDHFSCYESLPALQELALSCPHSICAIFLTSPIPWYQLKTLMINRPTNEPDFEFSSITNLLPHLTSLSKLELKLERSSEYQGLPLRTEEILSHGRPMFHLAADSKIFEPVIHCSALWKGFRSLCLENVSLYQLYNILPHCEGLASLTIGIIFPDKATDNLASHCKDLTLDHLIHLDILGDDEGGPFPTHILVPNLKSLKIRQRFGAYPFRETRNLLVRSNARPEKVICIADEPWLIGEHDTCPQPEDTLELLACLSSASSVDFRGFVLPSPTLEGIANRSFLPQVKSLNFCALPEYEMFSTIVERLALEKKQSDCCLQHVTLYKLSNIDSCDDEPLDERLPRMWEIVKECASYVDVDIEVIDVAIRSHYQDNWWSRQVMYRLDLSINYGINYWPARLNEIDEQKKSLAGGGLEAQVRYEYRELQPKPASYIMLHFSLYSQAVPQLDPPFGSISKVWSSLSLIRLLSRRRKAQTKVARLQLAIAVFGILLFTAFSAVQLAMIFAFLKYFTASPMSVFERTEKINSILMRWNIAGTWFSVICPVVNTVFVIWRAWVLFERRRWALHLSVWLGALTLVVTIIVISISSTPRFFYISKEQGSTTYALLFSAGTVASCLTNFVATSFVGHRLWVHTRILNKSQHQHLFKMKRILFLLFVTGFVYALLQLCVVIVSFVPSNPNSGIASGIFGTIYHSVSVRSFVYPALTVALIRRPLSGAEFRFQEPEIQISNSSDLTLRN
ncbi:hypothetical protein H0H93_008953 [Arthromyces matolae]|nr:hypothetical protein H0H93_008953 [Arthromyces matolae]